MADAPTILEFPDASLEVAAKLGEGAFGAVYKCRVLRWDLPGPDWQRQSSAPDSAWKAVKISGPQGRDMAMDEATRMQRAMLTAKPDFVPMFWFHGDGRKSQGDQAPTNIFGLCMDVIDGCSLQTLISHVSLTYSQACCALKDLFVALHRLHKHAIVHLDVKSDNILVRNNGECYLCDFGISLFLEDFPEGREMPLAGTPDYMAPEMFFPADRRRYNTRVDIWSAGIVGYELAVGRTPWCPDASMRPNQNAIFERLKHIEVMDLTPIPMINDFFGQTGPYAALLTRCLVVWPMDRACAETLLSTKLGFNLQDAVTHEQRGDLARISAEVQRLRNPPTEGRRP